MDHVEALRQKIGRLRIEIAQIQKDAQLTLTERQERLEAIQQELVQLSGLGRRVVSIADMKNRSQLHLVKKVS
ncbi:MAG TPA: hypothetical protein VFA90_13350 [Terriglobales bacterium]|nr:hypothetical protein [Terriglobales bacterium]